MKPALFSRNISINCNYQTVQTRDQQQLFGATQMNNRPNSILISNHPQPYGHELNESIRDNNIQTLLTPQKQQQLYQRVMANRQMRRTHHRLREKGKRKRKSLSHSLNPLRIGKHRLLPASLEGDVTDVKRQREREREAYNGCDSNGFVNFVKNSILCSTNKYKYSMMSELGRGTFSRVFQCQRIDDIIEKRPKQQYVIKITRAIKKYQFAAMNELTILKHIAANDVDDTSCCIHIVDCGVYFEHPMFVFPLLSKSLRTRMNSHCNAHILNPFCFTVEQVTHLMWQMCRAVAFIHALGIINTDLKPDNIMLVSNQCTCTQIKIIDFGSAVFHKKDRTYEHLIQSRQYRAPEVILGLPWSFQVDIWSLGCILVELADDKLLFPTHAMKHQSEIDTNRHHLHQIIECIGTPPSHLLSAIHEQLGRRTIDTNSNFKTLNAHFKANDNRQSAQLYDLCRQMLRWNPKQRISAKSALNHAIFTKYM